jgi:CheY-like chemotaxis protein
VVPPVPTILFVDNSRSIREFVKRELEGDGYRVLLAGNGAEALDTLAMGVPDLVVLDVDMPKIDGVETARRIREQNPELPVILYTSHTEPVGSRTRCPEVIWLEKSENLAELRRTVSTVLSKRGWVWTSPCLAKCLPQATGDGSGVTF